jgi:hypothetical protein
MKVETTIKTPLELNVSSTLQSGPLNHVKIKTPQFNLEPYSKHWRSIRESGYLVTHCEHRSAGFIEKRALPLEDKSFH